MPADQPVDGFSGALIEQQIQIQKHAPLVRGQVTDTQHQRWFGPVISFRTGGKDLPF